MTGSVTLPGFEQGEFGGAMEVFNALQGFSATGQSMVDPTTGLHTKWALTGNPVTGEGWLDRILDSPRSLMSTNVFSLAASESASITIAMMTVSDKNLELGIDRLMSLSDELRLSSKLWNTPRR